MLESFITTYGYLAVLIGTFRKRPRNRPGQR